MKHYIRALKLCWKSAFAYGMIVMLPLPLIMVSVILITAPKTAPVGSEDYMVMIASYAISQIGLIFPWSFLNDRLTRYKFFASVNCAKPLYTLSAITLSTCQCLGYHVVVTVLVAVILGGPYAADMLIAGALADTAIALCMFRHIKRASFLDMILYFAVISAQFWVDKIPALRNGFGLSLPAAVGAALLIFAVGGAYIAAISLRMWKKGDRILELPETSWLEKGFGMD